MWHVNGEERVCGLHFGKLPQWIGRNVINVGYSTRRLVSFALISLTVLLLKWRVARAAVGPLVREQLIKSGVKLMPLFIFLAAVIGLVVVGQTISWLTRVGAQGYLGSVMVVVVIRELGPVISAWAVLTRVGTANVVELSTARALGEVEALESLGIDPIHFFVVPKLVGLALSVFSLTVYFEAAVLFFGYAWAFFQDIPLTPGEYFGQIAAALGWLDFLVVGLKALIFGVIIAVVTCYHGLARPLQLEQVPVVTVRAVGQSIVALMVVDALFLLVYLIR